MIVDAGDRDDDGDGDDYSVCCLLLVLQEVMVA